MTRRILLPLILLSMFFLPLRLAAQPLADRVPADALFYAGWQGTNALAPQYEASHLKAVLDSTTLVEFLTEQLPEKLGSQNPQQAAQFKYVMQLARSLARFPTALYVSPFDMTDPRNPKVNIAILCDAGDQTKPLYDQLQPIVAAAAGKEPEVQLTASGGTLTLTVGKPNLDQPKLRERPEFQQAANLLKGDAALSCFLDTPKLIQAIDAAPSSEEGSLIWKQFCDEMGIRSVTQIAFAAGFDGPNWQSRSVIGLSNPQGSVIGRLLAPKPLAPDVLKNVPENATWCVVNQLDLPLIWNSMEAASRKAMPERAPQEIDRMYQQFQQATGVHLRDDVINTLGAMWILYRTSSAENPGLGATAIHPLKDSTKFAASLAKLEQWFTENQKRQAASGGLNLQIRNTRIAEMDVHSINAGANGVSWTIAKDRLIISASPESLAAAADQFNQPRSILDNERFQTVLRKLGVQDFNAIEYSDAPQIVPMTLTVLNQIVMLANLKSPVAIPASIIPSSQAIMPHLAPGGTVDWADVYGQHSYSANSFPGVQVLSGEQLGTVATASLGVSILLPSLGRSRELANRSADAANLKGISTSAVVWANENNDDMPDHMGDLVITQQVSPKSFISRRGSNQQLPLTHDMIDKAIQKLRTTGKYDEDIARIVDEGSDYVYIGKGTTNTTDSSVILMYEKPGLSKEGFNVAFYDAHAEWVRFTTPQRLAEVFKATNDYRKKLGLEPVDTDAIFEKATGRKR